MFNTAEKIRAKEISDAKNNFPGIQNLGEKEILKEISDSKKIVVANNYEIVKFSYNEFQATESLILL